MSTHIFALTYDLDSQSTASEMTYIVSSGALNSTPTNCNQQRGMIMTVHKQHTIKVKGQLVQWTEWTRTDTTDRNNVKECTSTWSLYTVAELPMGSFCVKREHTHQGPETLEAHRRTRKNI